ncbi:MAG TPA: hypothetical protein VFE13_14595 [Caulobacteraceae bacterium]|nr:hypothetical protein [Caulobacteraceae bacterium]
MHQYSSNRPARLRLGLAVAAALAAASVAACGQGGAGGATNGAGASEFDAKFNASFDKSTHDSCVTSATQHGAAADKAEKYCTCVVGELDKLSTADKMQLPMHQEKLKAAADACIAQVNG